MIVTLAPALLSCLADRPSARSFLPAVISSAVARPRQMPRQNTATRSLRTMGAPPTLRQHVTIIPTQCREVLLTHIDPGMPPPSSGPRRLARPEVIPES